VLCSVNKTLKRICPRFRTSRLPTTPSGPSGWSARMNAGRKSSRCGAAEPAATSFHADAFFEIPPSQTSTKKSLGGGVVSKAWLWAQAILVIGWPPKKIARAASKSVARPYVRNLCADGTAFDCVFTFHIQGEFFDCFHSSAFRFCSSPCRAFTTIRRRPKIRLVRPARFLAPSVSA
jgi:hypothetical protein